MRLFRTLLCLSAIAHVFSQEAVSEGTQNSAEAKADSGSDPEEDGVAHHNTHNASKRGQKYKAEWDALHEVHALREVHAEWDVNNDKKASIDELIKFTEAHHEHVLKASTNMETLLAARDTSKNGFISLEEHLNHLVHSEGLVEGKEKTKRIADETAMFKAADSNNDGMLDKNEFGAILFPETHVGTTNVLMDRSMRDTDANGDGKINMEEFEQSVDVASAVAQAGEHGVTDGELFQTLDKNGDGFLEKEELRPLKTGRIYRERMVNQVVGNLDKDGDSHVDAKELTEGKSTVYDSDLQAYLLAWAKRRQTIR